MVNVYVPSVDVADVPGATNFAANASVNPAILDCAIAALVEMSAFTIVPSAILADVTAFAANWVELIAPSAILAAVTLLAAIFPVVTALSAIIPVAI